MRRQKRVEDARERAYDPRIRVGSAAKQDVAGRVKPGHDDLRLST
jgi:hypothetical protein